MSLADVCHVTLLAEAPDDPIMLGLLVSLITKTCNMATCTLLVRDDGPKQVTLRNSLFKVINLFGMMVQIAIGNVLIAVTRADGQSAAKVLDVSSDLAFVHVQQPHLRVRRL